VNPVQLMLLALQSFLGLPTLILRILGFREDRCLCGKCMGVKGVIHLELHVVQGLNETASVEPVDPKSEAAKMFGAASGKVDLQ
jgi:hypothetical protein